MTEKIGRESVVQIRFTRYLQTKLTDKSWRKADDTYSYAILATGFTLG